MKDKTFLTMTKAVFTTKDSKTELQKRLKEFMGFKAHAEKAAV